MDTSEAPLPVSKPAEDQKTTAVPDGYKIVKVRKPDGTIVKVRRPIAKTAATETASPSDPTSKVAEKPAEIQSTPPVAGKPLSAVKPAPSDTPSKADDGKSSETDPSKTASASATPVHASKLETTAKGYRLFRKVHRVHRHASTLIQAFDPYSDVGDVQDGDVSVGSDDDYNSASEDSGDDNASNKKQQSNGVKGVSTGTHVNVNVGSNAATHRVVPATKQGKTDISVQELPREKGSSTDTDPVIREKELVGINDLEAAKAPHKGPRSLHRRSADWTKLIVWTLVIAFPILFIGLAIAVATLNLTSYPSEHGEAIVVANRAGVTMWPIVFAAIVAQTLKALATYRVERGIRLMTLEQLISSHSVASALKQPFVLRSLNWLTIGLLALWALSPLGSQAMQYTIGSEDRWIDNSTDIYYLNTAQDNLALQQIKSSNQEEIKESYSDSMAVLYAAVFQPISDYQPVGSDPWGNALVPVYEILNAQTTVQRNADGAIVIPTGQKLSIANATDDTKSYSSFYGIPIAQIDEYSGTWNFTMISSYLHFDCPRLASSTDAEIDLTGWDPLTSINGSGSLSMDMHPPTSTSAGSLFFRSNCSEKRTPNDEKTLAYTVCEFNQTFVESTVYCDDLECTVTSVKKIQGDPTSMYDFVDEFLKASDVGVDDYPDLGNSPYSATELYLLNPDNVTTPNAPGEVPYCDLPSVNSIDFNTRLSYLLNTFYSTGFTTDYEFGGLNATETIELYKDDDTVYTANLTTLTKGTTRFQDTEKPSIYTVRWAFLAIFVFCSVILLVIGVSGVLLEMRTISPDILGFASSVARHSKYVKLPATDGTMSGAEKARLLGDARVMMQDVRPTAEVGKIVLGTASEDAERLRAGRLYR